MTEDKKVSLEIPDESFVRCPKNRALIPLEYCIKECGFYKAVQRRANIPGMEQERFEKIHTVLCAFPLERNILVNRPIEDVPGISNDQDEPEPKITITD